MTTSRNLTIAVLLFACHLTVAGEPSLTPQHGVLLLKNRQTLAGDVTRVGDYYLVALGKTGEIKIAAKDVETLCHTIEEVYDYRKQAIIGKSPDVQLDLAEWCIRERLLAQAAQIIAEVRTSDPNHRRLATIEKKIEFAADLAKSPSDIKPAAPSRTLSSPSTVGLEQLERTMKQLPVKSVEHFTHVVQPILMDKCGAGNCHGSHSVSSFQLLQPVPGRVPSRRYTQRNLFATMSMVDKETPDESRLLSASLQAHGTPSTAAFKNENDRQYREIYKWVSSLRSIPEQRAPKTINTDHLTDLRQQLKPVDETPTTKTTTIPSSEGLPVVAPKPAKDLAATKQVDPFDPDIFNRRYHPQPK